MATPSKEAPAKSTPWWALTMAAALSVAVLAFAMRSGSSHGQTHEVVAADGAPSTGAIATGEARREGAPMTLAAASETVSIEMYSATWCTACSRAKAWLREQNIQYHEIDVDQRSGAMGQLAVLNPRRTLPTFDVQGQVLVGFEPDALAGAIRGAAR
ncbi:MAG: glutaredoxin family protein [Sandaracinaceae bacterium]|jgi:glutaredoxin|nr:glutaredoxin family protein [Sandaracinaceae bacterium]